MFERVHGGVYSRKVSEDIRKRLALGNGYNVIAILKQYMLHRSLGLKYTGDHIVEGTVRLGRPPILDVGGVEAQILADNLEDGVSIGVLGAPIDSKH